MNNKKKLFIGIGIFWLVLLTGFIGIKEYTLKTGTEVLLKLRPVDPRDLFRGDYVILSYDISSITAENLPDVKEGDTVFTLLSLNGEIAEYTGITKIEPANGLFLKGTASSVRASTISITYGIESYFVPEGEGLKIERSRSNMFAKISIGSSGSGVIKSLIQNGEEITF